MSVLNKIFPRTVGIDIGSASVKVVEVSKFGKKTTLKNYAHLESATYDGKPFRAFEKETLFLSGGRSSEAIRACFDAAEIQPQKAVFSLPDFSSFFVSFDLPPMSGGELTKAINFHASKYVPIPMDEIVLDWQKVGPSSRKTEQKDSLHILAVAIPKKTMEQYRQVAEAIGISNFALEPEAFSLFRVFVSQDESPSCIIDFGAKSTTLSFGDKHGLQSSHSLDVAGDKIVAALIKSGLEEGEAIAFLQKEGFNSQQPEAREVLSTAMKPLANAFNESWQAVQRRTTSNKRPQVVLAGGMALMPGIQDHLSGILNTTVRLGDPLSRLECPPALGAIAREVGPPFGVAIGASLRNF